MDVNFKINPLLNVKNMLLAFALLFPFHLFAQTTCNPVFQKYYGGKSEGDEEATAVTYCKGGGMIVCGQTTSYSAGQYDGFLLKLTENGTPEWTKIIGSTGNDKLIQVRQTTDGGFIALGETRSFANVKGEPWIIKTDALGNIQWNKRYGQNAQNREKPKDIIQMKDGGYCFAMNSNDSTAGNNAIIIKLNSDGNILWSGVFDQGNDDGVNNIAEHNDTLLVAGYATGDGRDAIVTKLNKADGSFISAKKISNRKGTNDEALGIEVVDDGIAFSVSMNPAINPNFSICVLSHYRMAVNGSILYHRSAQVSTNSGQMIEAVQSRATDDKGFIYLANDITAGGNSTCIKVGPYGMLEWGRNFYDYGYNARTTGMDITADKGYVFAGYKNEYVVTSMKNKIQVFKTDRLGKTGKCPLALALDFIDTAQNSITAFTWNSIQASAIRESGNAMSVSSNLFTVISSCEQMLCDTVQTLQDGCNSGLLAEYKSELNIDAADIIQLSDGGYAMAGSYSYYWNLEPCIIKTNPNGSIAWAKTFGDFTHNGRFARVVPTNDNALLAMGMDEYSIDHTGKDSAMIMKIDYSGNVLWAKKYGKGSGSSFGDMQPTDDGGCIIIETDNYGSGTGQYTVVARLDASGNFVWKKQLNTNNLIIRGLLTDHSAVYTYGTSSVYTNIYGFIGQVSVVKLNAATGDSIWQKQLRSTIPAQSLYTFSLGKAGDSLIAAVELTTPVSTYDTKKEVGFIKMSTANGSLYGAYKITNLNYLSVAPYNRFNTVWAGVSGNDVFFANKAAVNYDTSLYITRVSPDGKLVWSKKYAGLKKQTVLALKQADGGVLLAGTRAAGQLDVNVPEAYPFILKANEKGDVADNPVSASCMNNAYVAAIEPFSLTDGGRQVNEVIKLQESAFFGNFTYVSYTPYVRDIQKGSKVFCNKPSNCTSVSIAGPDSVCDLRNPVLYSLVRNPGCDAAALWFADTSFARIMAFTDSTISLQYKRPGAVSLRAAITSGCTGLSAEKTVSIARQAGALNLGPDTVLCANAAYTLRAGTGYRNYRWSHNDSADSLAVISSPGMYVLTVTDFCGNIFSDTVTVKPAVFAFSAGPDISKCNGDTVLLTATAGFINYTWQPAYNIQHASSPTAGVFHAADTSYIVQAEKWAGCFVHDTVRITVKTSPKIQLGNDTSLCAGQTLTLQAGNNFIVYQWSNGDDRSQTAVNSTGRYTIHATTADGCHSYDTINIIVRPLPVVRLDHNTTLCIGSTRILDAGSYTSYYWQDGSTTKTFTAKSPGRYYVQVTDQYGCTESDTTIIADLIALPSAFLPADTSICSYGSLSIQPNRNFSSYQWNTSETSRSIKVSQPGRYWLQVKDDHNCTGSDSITVSTTECRTGLFVPTAFTPDNDGKNDKLRALIFGNIKTFNFSIYNRFGQMVFHTSDPLQGWDGKIHGINQDAGAYVWLCKYQLDNGRETTDRGTTILMR